MRIGLMCQFNEGADYILHRGRAARLRSMGHEVVEWVESFRVGPLRLLILWVRGAWHMRRCREVLVQKALPLGLMYVLLLRVLAPRVHITGQCDDWEGCGGFASIRSAGNPFKIALVTLCEEAFVHVCDSVWCVSRCLYDRWYRVPKIRKKMFYIPNGGE